MGLARRRGGSASLLFMRGCRSSSRAVARVVSGNKPRPKTECNRRAATRDSPTDSPRNPNSAASAFRFRRVQCALFPLALPRPPIASTLATSAIGNERSRTRHTGRRCTPVPTARRVGCTARASDPRTLALRNTCSYPPRSPFLLRRLSATNDRTARKASTSL